MFLAVEAMTSTEHFCISIYIFREQNPILNNGFAFVLEVGCFYTVIDSSAESDGWWEQAVNKATHKQTDNTQTQLLEVKPEVWMRTDWMKTDSYQFYSCLQTATERKDSFIEMKEIKKE